MSAPKEIWVELLLGEICTTPPSSVVASRYARYILATPEALADAPEVVALVEAAVKAERERCAEILDRRHGQYMIARGRNPADYTSEFSLLAAAIRAGGEP